MPIVSGSGIESVFQNGVQGLAIDVEGDELQEKSEVGGKDDAGLESVVIDPAGSGAVGGEIQVSFPASIKATAILKSLWMESKASGAPALKTGAKSAVRSMVR